MVHKHQVSQLNLRQSFFLSELFQCFRKQNIHSHVLLSFSKIPRCTDKIKPGEKSDLPFWKPLLSDIGAGEL